MKGKGKRPDASWTHGEEVAGERIIPDSDAPQVLQFGKESGRIGMGSCTEVLAALGA